MEGQKESIMESQNEFINEDVVRSHGHAEGRDPYSLN